jgi:hypothetical protein
LENVGGIREILNLETYTSKALEVFESIRNSARRVLNVNYQNVAVNFHPDLKAAAFPVKS